MRIAKYLIGFLVVVSLAVAAPQNIPGIGNVEKAVGGKVGGLLDLNSASLKQLTSLPGITSTLAKQIIKGRPFKAPTDLVSKNILSQTVFDQIKNLITVKPK